MGLSHGCCTQITRHQKVVHRQIKQNLFTKCFNNIMSLFCQRLNFNEPLNKFESKPLKNLPNIE